MSKRTYYDVLGLPDFTDIAEVKKTYRKLAKQYHPDANKGDATAEAKFKEISEAYGVIGSPTKKGDYDSSIRGLNPFTSGGFNFGPDWLNLEDLFDSMFNQSQQKVRHRGSNIEIILPLTLEELFKSKLTKTITFNQQERCAKCDGWGGEKVKCETCGGLGQVLEERFEMFNLSLNQSRVCPSCNGKGYKLQTICHSCQGKGMFINKRSIMITLPEHVKEDTVLKVTGKGNAAVDSKSRNGDLIIRIRFASHSIFQRRGQHDLLMTLPLKMSKMLLGGDVEFDTISGKKRTIQITRDLDLNNLIMVRNDGLPKNKDKTMFGDLYIKTTIDIPESLTEEQTKVLEKLSKCGL